MVASTADLFMDSASGMGRLGGYKLYRYKIPKFSLPKSNKGPENRPSQKESI